MGRGLQPAIAVAAVLSAVVGGVALAAQDRSTLKVPDGLPFSEFKGYEDWQAVAVSQTQNLKLIAANPAMMRAFKQGLPAAGKTFPEGSKVVKIEWLAEKNPVSPYEVRIPRTLKSLSFIEKDSRRFPNSHGWGYAKFELDPASGELKPSVTGTDCGNACHSAAVAAQDYIFTAYPAR
jgi:Cytochrome P460